MVFYVSLLLMVNGTFFLAPRLRLRKSFPEYYNSSLLELIYSICLCFPIWGSFSKLPHFCYLPQTVEPEGRKSMKMTRLSFLFSRNHIHIWLKVQKKNEMSRLLTSVPQEKILAVCQNHPGTFPDQFSTKQCIKQTHQAAWKYCITARAGKGEELKGGFGNSRMQIDCTFLKPPLFPSAW